MMRLCRPAVLPIVVLLALAATGAAQIKTNDPKPDGQPAELGLVGTWHAMSTSMSLDDRKHRTLTDEDGAVSVIISDKTFTLQLGVTVLMNLSYVADSKRNPCTIELRSKDIAMTGIYNLGGDRLTISLNDKTKGRPSDFGTQKNGLVLLLRRVHGVSLFTIDADGGNLRRILSLADFTFLGSPDWSPDGRKIAIDSWRPTMGEACGNARIFIVNLDDSSLKGLGPGAMPSWSPDGKQLTYCQYGQPRGVWIMNADGTGRQSIDVAGWSSQWSPKHNEIAYVVNDNGAADICIYNAATKQRRPLLDKTYNQVYWGLTWSPDGKWICFKGDMPDGRSEIAAVSVEGEKKGFKVILPSTAQPEIGNADTTLAWGGTGGQILVSMQTNTDRVARLYVFDFASNKPPKLFPGIPADWQSFAPAWSPGGKKVVFSAVPPIPPVPAKPK